MHPPALFIKSLEHKKGTPCNTTVDIQPFITYHLQFGTVIKRSMRVDVQNAFFGQCPGWCHCKSIGTSLGLFVRRRFLVKRSTLVHYRIKVPEFLHRYAAGFGSRDAAIGTQQCKPGLEAVQCLWFYMR